MNFLVDHNLRGHSVVLAGTVAASGWLELVTIRFVMFEAVGLADTSDDRLVWQNTPTSLPVVTIGNIDRLMAEPDYRERCVDRLADIVADIEAYRGAQRIFIP